MSRSTALFLLLFLTSPSIWPASTIGPVASIDLSQHEWGAGHAFSLAGDWSFAWQQLPEPQHAFTNTKWRSIPVPGAWNSQREQKDSYPSMGYATYALRIIVPVNLPSVYLHLPDMASAYKLWVNGEPLAGNGVVGQTRLKETPAYLPKVIQAQAINGVVELLIHTSNYHYQWGGLWYAPTITDESGVFAMRELPFIKASIAGTLLISTGLLSLALYLFRRGDKKVLYFSLLCFAVGIRRLVIDERVLYWFEWFNGLGWHTLQRIENIIIYLLLPLFSSYFYYWFPKETNRKLITLSWLACAPFCLAALFLEVHTYTQFNIPFQLLMLVIIPYIFFVYTKAYKAQRTGTKMFGFSLLVFAACVINDILNYSYIINTPTMIHYGAIAFVLFQLSALVRRYLLNFKTIEALSAELKDHNEELVKLDEYKDEFLATTSHELRTPLHGISELALLLKEDAEQLSHSQKHKIDLIESTSKRLGNLVNDILDYSSIKHGKLSLSLSPALLAPLANNVIQTLKPLAKGKQLILQCELESDPEYVMADAYRLQQILFNLLGNAIKFTESGSIRLFSERIGDYVKIIIEDTGSGIPEDKIDILFQPFEQYSKNEHTSHNSTGLGLSIARQLVQLHAGDLTLSSTLGKGTRAEFTLPVVNTTQLSTPTHENAPTLGAAGTTKLVEPEHNDITLSATGLKELDTSNASTNALTQAHNKAFDITSFYVPADHSALIYYADDEEVNREIVRSLLRNAGYVVETFTNAQSLINSMQEKLPELILLDLMMPGMSGLEACQKIRQHHDCYELPIMMLTARYQVSDIVEALGSGANDYLAKPYHEKELLARLYSQLSVHRLWTTSIENEQLKSEIDLRDQKEIELTSANLRLQHALNVTDQGLLLLNEEFDIVFANQQSCELLNRQDNLLLGSPFTSLLTPESLQLFHQFTSSNESEFELSTKLPDSNASTRLTIRSFTEDEDTYLAVILETPNKQSNTQNLLQDLTHELAQNRQRIDQIEIALSQVSREESANRGLTGSISNNFELREESAKELVVRTLRTALSTWERYTQLTKADLAEKSHCWRVYIDGTTAKTRTLDKYLTTKSLPSKPRWRAVIQTANYVIDHCELSQEDHNELLDLINALDTAYS